MQLGLRDSGWRLLGRRAAQAVVVLLVLVTSLPLLPATAVAEPAIDVELGYGGRHRFGTDLLVQVEVVADRLIDGEILISFSAQAPVEVVIPVEIAGGARKRFVAVVPALPQRTSVTVNLVEGGNILASLSPVLQDAAEDQLVGVLPSLSTDMPISAELAVPLGEALLFPIDDALLSAGPGAVDALSAIIASAADLAQLSEPARVSLETWIERGGSLIVDEAPGPVPGLGVATGDRPTPIGVGSVVASNGVFSLGAWDGAIKPAPFRSTLEGDGGLTGELTGEVAWFGGPLANSLANDAGFGLPPLRVVLPFMAIYVLIVGPLTFIILRRLGRSQLLWLALPALAFAFTAAVWVSGATLRSNTSDAHGTLIHIENGTATAESTILRSSRNGGSTGLTLPAPWQPTQTVDFQFGGPSTNILTIRPALDSTRVEAELDAGEFALFGGSGPVPTFDDALVATAVSTESGRITGTVTNQLDVTLNEVAVFTAFLGINVGSIGPGESLSFELSGPDRDPRFGEPLEIKVWPAATQGRFRGPFDGGPTTTQSPVNIELWSSFIGQNIGRVRQQGWITVVGWTNELASPLDGAITSGRSGIVLRQRVETNGASMTDLSGSRVLLRGPDQANFQPGFGGPGFNVPSSWRLDIDPGVDPANLALQLPGELSSIELWDGEQWLELDDPIAGHYELPPGSLIDGSVYTKPVVDFERSPMLGRSFSLQTVAAAIDLLTDFLTAEATP